VETISKPFQKNNSIHLAGYWHWVGHYLVEQPIVLVALAVGVRLPILWLPLWYDEAFTQWLVTLPVSQLIAATAGDVHPPLFYLVAWASAHIFGVNAFSIRLPALVFGSASIVVFGAILAETTLPKRVKTIALWLAVFSPWLAYYSAEGRMYGMLLFFVLVAAYGAQRGDLPLLVIGSVLGLYTQNLAVLYFPALWIMFLRKAGLKQTMIGGLAVVVLYLPWLPVVLKQMQAVKSGYWISQLSVGRVIGVIYELSAETASNANTLIITAAIVYSLLAIGIVMAVKHRAGLLLTFAFAPLTVAVIISLLFRPIITAPPRVLIGASPFLITLLAWGVDWLRRPAGCMAWALGLVVVVMWGNLLFYPVKTAPSWARLNLSGVCYHMLPSSIVVARVYAPDCDNYGWGNVGSLEQSLTQDTVNAMGMDIRPFDDLPPGDVYLFFSDAPYTTPTERTAVSQLLDKYSSILMDEHDEFGIVKSYIYRIER